MMTRIKSKLRFTSIASQREFIEKSKIAGKYGKVPGKNQHAENNEQNTAAHFHGVKVSDETLP